MTNPEEEWISFTQKMNILKITLYDLSSNETYLTSIDISKDFIIDDIFHDMFESTTLVDNRKFINPYIADYNRKATLPEFRGEYFVTRGKRPRDLIDFGSNIKVYVNNFGIYNYFDEENDWLEFSRLSQRLKNTDLKVHNVYGYVHFNDFIDANHALIISDERTHFKRNSVYKYWNKVMQEIVVGLLFNCDISKKAAKPNKRQEGKEDTPEEQKKEPNEPFNIKSKYIEIDQGEAYPLTSNINLENCSVKRLIFSASNNGIITKNIFTGNNNNGKFVIGVADREDRELLYSKSFEISVTSKNTGSKPPVSKNLRRETIVPISVWKMYHNKIKHEYKKIENVLYHLCHTTSNMTEYPGLEAMALRQLLEYTFKSFLLEKRIKTPTEVDSIDFKVRDVIQSAISHISTIKYGKSRAIGLSFISPLNNSIHNPTYKELPFTDLKDFWDKIEEYMLLALDEICIQ